jgi:thiosulfate dehydrogenase
MAGLIPRAGRASGVLAVNGAQNKGHLLLCGLRTGTMPSAALRRLALAFGFAATAAIAGEGENFPGWSDAVLPEGPVGEAIALGRRILTHTPENAPAYAGNALNCTSCHLDAGRTVFAAPWVGIWGVFPEYRSRNAKVNALQDRINDCFERSINGRALPLDSPEMAGILASCNGCRATFPPEDAAPRLASEPAALDAERGAVLCDKCATCHGPDGQGMYGTAGETASAAWGPRPSTSARMH